MKASSKIKRQYSLKLLLLILTIAAVYFGCLRQRSVLVRCNHGLAAVSDMGGDIRAGEIVSVFGELPDGEWSSVLSGAKVSADERAVFENGNYISYIQIDVPAIQFWKKDRYKNYRVEVVSGPYHRPKIRRMDRKK